MIHLKDGVRLTDLQPQTVFALLVAERVYDRHGVGIMVVTSVNDGTHKPTSLHYQGMACDLRMHNVPHAQRQALHEALRTALGPDFDVLWEYQGTEREHVHVEWDVK